MAFPFFSLGANFVITFEPRSNPGANNGFVRQAAPWATASKVLMVAGVNFKLKRE
jgi:hypothetical protein